MSDAPTVPRCACPRDGARACYRFRYGLDLREMFGDDDGEDNGVCECSCHEEHDDGDSDWTGDDP